MHLNRILLRDFKNIAAADLEFSPRINCISGSNGAGKTNLLDAGYYLSMTKSFFSPSDQYLCRFGTSETVATGFYAMDGGQTEKISVSVRKGAKTVLRGVKAYERFSDHIGLLPVVMVSPADTSLVNEGGDDRRRYLNSLISQVDREYLRHIQAYNALLLRRNHTLKMPGDQTALLDTLTGRMAPHADYVFRARKELCDRLEPIVNDFYRALSPQSEAISLRYRSSLEESDFFALMERNRERDRTMGFTLGGPQRDDIHFSLDGHPLRRCGSQGQQKSFLVALKLAQLRFMRESGVTTPILLLDDVFDKLDMARVENLVGLVSTTDFGQIFFSDSNKVRLSAVVESLSAECAHFSVREGECRRLPQ